MSEDIYFEIHHDLPREGPGRDRYTRKAYHMLGRLESPRILDVGCGPGAPTVELARLSGGEVIGLDIRQPLLDQLAEKAEREGLSDRVKTLNRSMFDMDFPEQSFDVIWSEGSIYVIGFEKGLYEWRRLIKPRGFLAVHDVAWLNPDPPAEIRDYWKKSYPAILTIDESLERIPGLGYLHIGHFPLPEDAWWHEYYGPLQERINMLREKYAGRPRALEVLDREQEEIELYKKYCHWYGSAFFIMQRSD